MAYSEEQIAKLAVAYGEVIDKRGKLVEAYTSHRYANELAADFGKHGFARRMMTLSRCIENVYRILPPAHIGEPVQEQRYDAMINLQAFIMNAFGAIDNLAWVWVSEKGRPLNRRGDQITDKEIGFRAHNTHVRRSMSDEFQTFIATRDSWLEYLTDFRDALAHKIPLYIPPHAIPHDKVAAYQEFERKITEAAIHGDVVELERLSNQQQELVRFMPLMRHSVRSGNKWVPFHIQLIADFNTVEEMGDKLLLELSS
ncbi:hypothetical protein [Dongia sp.]|uniref:hypothetical protein n=1 Tax=Dongia sp. TaxID=1977262 RepID=UPI0035B4AFC1